MKKLLICITILSTCLNLAISQKISSKQALSDLSEFKHLLRTESSYYQLSNSSLNYRFDRVKKELETKDSVSIISLADKLESIMAEIIDRHANIRFKVGKQNKKLTNLHFPFALAPYNGKIIALKEVKKDDNNKTTEKEYDYYNRRYPELKSINGYLMDEFIDRFCVRRKLSPLRSKYTSSTKDIRDIGELYYMKEMFNKKDVEVVLTNGKRDKKLTLQLSSDKHKWIDKSNSYYINTTIKLMYKKDFSNIFSWIDDSIAYVRIPQMLSLNRYPAFRDSLISGIEQYRGAKSLIIDIRDNGGGTRDILNLFAGYIIQPSDSPWVANVAFVRSDQNLNEDIESMQGRYLYNYNSEHLTKADRTAIKQFKKQFKPKRNFDNTKFSAPFFMVLKRGVKPLNCPVYILVNERCFSAASVFTSALKGLKNVTIVGVTTNGSSGRSKKFYLKHSNIRVKLSTMLSFQRDGTTLDGNGTEPDIIIERDLKQILGKRDTQLIGLLELIK